MSCRDFDWEKTHPWLTFSADLRSASPGLWMLLGEARSKCEHIRGVPLRPDTARDLHVIYLAKGVQATTAIEGNTLSLDEVRAEIEGELKLPPSREYLQREVANVARACEVILNGLVKRERPRKLTPELVLEYNRLVLQGLDVDDGVVPGQFRRHTVGVARYRAPLAKDCEELVGRMCEWLNGPAFDLKGFELAASILKAVLAHLYLAWIHPFGDGNGRTARLLEFHILVAAGIPSPAAHLLSNHYNQTRSEYYRQLERASASGGDIVPFLSYALQGFVDQLREQLEVIRNQQWDVTWRNYVHEFFKGNASAVAERQRHLVLEMSRHDSEWIEKSVLRSISPRVAGFYAGKTEKTLSRDLNALQEMRLIEIKGGKTRANREVILAFLPAVASDSDSPASSSARLHS